MERYLIETPHTEGNCKLVVNEVHALGYLHNFDWGCEAGIHCGWAIIEAESEAQAKLAVPLLVREAARVIPLVKYSFNKAQELHDGSSPISSPNKSSQTRSTPAQSDERP